MHTGLMIIVNLLEILEKAINDEFGVVAFLK